jgi:hypothetical protein
MQEFMQDDEQANAEEVARLAKLASFASVLAKKKTEAVDARKLSGIEEIWTEDDSYYSGVDSVNGGDSMVKASSPAGRVTMRNRDTAESSKSTVFVNITAPYVDMSSARVADMVLPTDDKPFSIKATPIPEIIGAIDNHEEMMPGGQHTVGQASQAFIDEMTKKAELAETWIWDQLVESRWHGEVRKVIESAARIGSGVMKGPFPTKVKKRKMSKGEDGTITLIIEDEVKPGLKWIDAWNLYPDPSCGENIHEGSFIWERDFINARQLRDLKGTGYIDSEIDAVLKEGPNKNNIDSKGKVLDTKEAFEIWYYYGMADAEDMLSAGCECEEGTMIPVVISMINDRIIKASTSILDSGSFPYDVMCWQRRSDHWAGVGVSRQVRTSQRMVNAAARNLMDNAGIAAGPQIIMRDGVVYPADGSWEITPMKIWRVDEDADIANVQHAITSIVIPTMQAELENIIKLALDFAEKATSMPLMMQGQQGSATETVGGMNILKNSSNTVLRRIAKIFDDDLCEPIISRMYEWLMIYGEDEEMKGDYAIQALGSSSFYERDSANQIVMSLIPMAGNPAFGLNPELLMTEILKMNKISPSRVLFTAEERKQQQEQAAQNPPPQDPRIAGQIEVAKLRTQGDLQKAQLVQQSDQAEIQAKGELAKSEMELKVQLSQEKMQHDKEMLQMQLNLEMLKISQSQQISIDQIKASLASDSMKLTVQQRLSSEAINANVNKASNPVTTPPTEPSIHAPDNQAYAL